MNDLLFALSGSLITILLTLVAYFVKRLIDQRDREGEKGQQEDLELRTLIGQVETESLIRDDEAQKEIGKLRQYVDLEFVRHREFQGIKDDFAARWSELKNDMEKNFDRIIRLIEQQR